MEKNAFPKKLISLKKINLEEIINGRIIKFIICNVFVDN